jgi:hypothetical protein
LTGQPGQAAGYWLKYHFNSAHAPRCWIANSRGWLKKRFRDDGEKFGKVGSLASTFYLKSSYFNLLHWSQVGVVVFSGAKGFAINASHQEESGVGGDA